MNKGNRNKDRIDKLGEISSKLKETPTFYPKINENRVVKKRIEDNKFRDNVLQSNVITQSFLPFTKLESNLFVILLSTLKVDTLTYSLSVKQIMEILNIKDSHYKTIIDGLEGLYDKSIMISDGSKVKKIRLLSMIEYDKVLSDGGFLNVEICMSIVPHLFNLKNNFTIFQLNSYLQLKHTNSKKLYTLLSQWKSVGRMTMSIYDLQQTLGVNYKDTPKFLYSVINPSIKEILKTTNIENIKIHKIKQSRSITHLTFEFDWVERQLQLQYPPTLKTDITHLELYQRLIEKYRQTPKNTIKILENIPHKDIRIGLREIQMGVSDGRIKNVGSYTYQFFKNNYDLI
jgi:plasmid replication initiation protein